MIGISDDEWNAMTQAGAGRGSAVNAATDPRLLAPTTPTAAPTSGAAPSMLASGVRGAIQGVTAGFGDEAAGAGAAAGNALNKVGLLPAVAAAVPGIGQAISALALLAGSKGKNESFSDTYARVRDSERAANQAASDTNPVSYTSSQVIGTLVPTLLTDGVAPTVAGLAKTGALIGAGNSDANTIGGVAKDAALNAATNVVGGKALQLGGVAAQKGLNAASKRALDTSLYASEEPFANGYPSVIKGAFKGVKDLANPFKDGWSKAAAATAATPALIANPLLAAVPVGLAALKGAGEPMLQKAALADVAKGGTGMIGDKLAASSLASGAGSAGQAVAANIGTSEPGKEAGNSVLEWVKNTLGLDTPAGQQNLPQSFRDKMAADATEVQNGNKDGKPVPEVPNVIKQDGHTFIVTPSGAKVQID